MHITSRKPEGGGAPGHTNGVVVYVYAYNGYTVRRTPTGLISPEIYAVCRRRF